MAELDRSRIPKLILGLTIVAVGVLFMLDQVDLADADELLVYWPVALILIGLAQLAGGTRRQTVWGWLLIGVGAWILLYNLEIIDVPLWPLFWPAILVLIGVNLILGALRKAAQADGGAVVNAFAFWRGLERQVSNPDFRGGDLTAIMGGCEVDLRQAKIVGEPPTLNAFAFWGGIEIKVPKEWRVDFRVVPLLAGASDESAAPASDQAPTLVVTGMAIMGVIEVQN